MSNALFPLVVRFRSAFRFAFVQLCVPKHLNLRTQLGNVLGIHSQMQTQAQIQHAACRLWGVVLLLVDTDARKFVFHLDSDPG